MRNADDRRQTPRPATAGPGRGKIQLTLTAYHVSRPECKMKTITTSQDARNVQERIKSIGDVISMGKGILIKLESF